MYILTEIYFRALPLSFAVSLVAVGNGMTRAVVVTTQTHRALLAPYGHTVLHGDIIHGATFHAYTAAYAASVGMEGLGRHGMADEPRIDDVRLNPRERTSNQRRRCI